MDGREVRFRGLLAVVGAALAASGIGGHDRATWGLEVLPVAVALPVLAATRRRFRLTPLVYGLLGVHAVVLLVGGHWTYERVPAGEWVRDALDLARNPYDRLGHFVQGFVPAMLVRELLLRTSPLRRGGWLFTLTTSVCLAFSAFYELLEWWTAAAIGAGADAFLFLALVGAVVAQLALARLHDRQLARQ